MKIRSSSLIHWLDEHSGGVIAIFTVYKVWGQISTLDRTRCGSVYVKITVS